MTPKKAMPGDKTVPLPISFGTWFERWWREAVERMVPPKYHEDVFDLLENLIPVDDTIARNLAAQLDMIALSALLVIKRADCEYSKPPMQAAADAVAATEAAPVTEKEAWERDLEQLLFGDMFFGYAISLHTPPDDIGPAETKPLTGGK